MVLTRNQARMKNNKRLTRSKSKNLPKRKIKTRKIKKKTVKKKRINKKIQKTKSKKKYFKKSSKPIQDKKKSVKKLLKDDQKPKVKENGKKKLMGTNSTNLEEPNPSIENKNLDNISVENQPAPEPKQRYSFRKRVKKMKENPDLFKENWGVSDAREDSRFYREERRNGKYWSRRRPSEESYDGRGSGRRRGFSRRGNPNRRIRRSRIKEPQIESETDEEERKLIENLHPCSYDRILSQKISNSYKDLTNLKRTIVCKIASQKKLFYFEQSEQIKNMKSSVPEEGIPIYADIQCFDWGKLKRDQMECGGRLFDAIMMDPPWQLSSSQPSRGVAIGYSSLSDDMISRIPIRTLQKEGFLFIWVINAKYGLALQLFEKWGYKLIDEIAWVKRTVTGKIAKGHGFYLQHSKETCLVGFKGDFSQFSKKNSQVVENNENGIHKTKKTNFNINIANDVIFSERRGQSQKPNEIYDIIEQLVPNGFYLEIFGRRNNLKSGWVTIGNEL